MCINKINITSLVEKENNNPRFIPTHLLENDVWINTNDYNDDWMKSNHWTKHVKSITEIVPNIIVVIYNQPTNHIAIYKGKLII